MGYPRSATVSSDSPGFYHCVSRCVRRAWLCGDDAYTGKNFDHRRKWIERRLRDLADSFAVGLYAWAVMDNHSHVVLRIDPKLPLQWSDEEVAARWVRIRRTLDTPLQREDQVNARINALLEQPETLRVIRARLGNLSYFMRFLNECIARQANAEDGCAGRFWEGRFKCQALLDDSAVLACMTYVDLNPIRAGIADDLAGSDFTTIQRRLESLGNDPDSGSRRLAAVAGEVTDEGPEMSINGYVELLDWTARIARPDRGHVSPATPGALSTIRGSPDWWSGCVLRIENVFGSVVGTPASLRARVNATGQRWIRGLSHPG